MNSSLPKMQQKAGYSLKKRVKRFFGKWFTNNIVKSQDMRFVTINDYRFKRLIMQDSFLAAEIERQHDAFRDTDYFPKIVTRYENEVLVQFIDGTPLDIIDEPTLHKIADFYAALYTHKPRQVPLSETPYGRRLDQDLRFLQQVGAIDDQKRARLQAFAGERAPVEVWIGFDYIDPTRKNFVIASGDGSLRAIDMESLVDEHLIGTGIARACSVWLAPHRDTLLTLLSEKGAAPFREYVEFVELAFVANWMKRRFLMYRHKGIDPAVFDPFRAQ